MNRWELLVGMYNGAATVDNSVAISQKKIKNGTIIQSSDSTSGYPREVVKRMELKDLELTSSNG